MKQYLKNTNITQNYYEINNDENKDNIPNRVEAVFLDRDGTINVEVNLLHKVEDFKLIPQVGEAIKIFNNLHIPTIVVTNQPVVARNLCDEKTVQEIHEHMKQELKKDFAYVDEIYYCPHHPEKNHAEGNPLYRIECDCRKPKPGMLLKAKNKFGFNLENCFMIGDSTRDILAAKNAGCRSILVKTGYGGEDKLHTVTPDYTFNNLMDAAIFIEKYNKTTIKNIIKDIQEKFSNKKQVIVLIGGCSRTGKTTLAKDIQKYFENKKKCEILTLDNWLIDKDKRPANSKVIERFDCKEIVKSIEELLKGKDIKTYVYDINTMKRIGEEMFSSDIELLIIEGVIGLNIERLRELADITIFKDERDEIRKLRLIEYFKDRDMTLEEKEKIIGEREIEEIPYIKESVKYAKYIY